MKLTLTIISILFTLYCHSQVGIGTTVPHQSSSLDITSNNSGLLIPRMLEVDRTTIATPAEGLLVYQTDNTSGFYYFDGDLWQVLGGITNGITNVIAGSGLVGGGSSGSVLLEAIADNGLNVNAGADAIRMGGALVEDTTIDHGNFGMTYDLTGSGNFLIESNNKANMFFVDASLDRIGIGTDLPTNTLDINGTLRVRGTSATNPGDVLMSQDNLGTAVWSNSGFGMTPIGSIVAWHGNLPGVGALPIGWVECNGGTVSDTDSPVNGRPIPNLNNNTVSQSGDYSKGRFLRGSTTSGQFQADITNNLASIFVDDSDSGNSLITTNDDGNWSPYARMHGNSSVFGGGNSRMRVRHKGVETRVVNMSVRWIMRIK
jgi:hypothetical protein